ncbi:family 16 glycosylhydrolase [uncultured Rothia sp.]|uniref:family 16 glycosylhydrolase n=1 Tax=uncultured Rothia sp. TaxID=316088 RepID=UPI0025FA1824|nr:family 16 glycosylhydrolase [uncultured Rothia sp.]
MSKLPVMAALTVAMGASVAVMPMSAATAAPASVDSATSTSGLPTAVASGYKLTFSDEFNGPLDTTKWGYQYGCFDPAQRSQAQYTDSPDNVSVRDGYLNLTARYSPMKTKWDGTQIPRTCKSGSTTYDALFTSGMITTKYAAPASGFYAEARIKLPTARSSWSSFWATGTDEKLGGWPGNGEIDVFESKGYDPTYLMSNVHSPRVSNPKKTEQHQGMMHGDTATSQSEFHTYGVLKSADAIEFYFDGQLTHRVKMSDIKGPNPFVDPENNFTLKLNHMVGGNYLARPKDGRANDWSDKTYVDASKFADDYKSADGAGSTMYVDYVRVYEPKTEADQPAQPEPTPAPEQPTPTPAPEQPAQPEPTPAPSEPAQPQPTPAPENPVTPAPENPAQPADPTPVPTPETPAQPEDLKPETPAPEQPKPVTPAPAKPTPAKPTPAQPSAPSENQTDQNSQQSGQAEQSEQSKQTKPEQPKKSKKPSADRLANTGMTAWYRPVVVMWRSFCGWITSWWFW